MCDENFDSLTKRQLELRLPKMFSKAFKDAIEQRSSSDQPALEREPQVAGVTAEKVARDLTRAVADRKRQQDRLKDRLTIDQRMLLALQSDSTLINRSRLEWKYALECSESAVQKASTWRTIQKLRADAMAERSVRG